MATTKNHNALIFDQVKELLSQVVINEDHMEDSFIFIGDSETDGATLVCAGSVFKIANNLALMCNAEENLKEAMFIATGFAVTQADPIKGEFVRPILDSMIGLNTPDDTNECNCAICDAKRAQRQQKVKSDPTIN